MDLENKKYKIILMGTPDFSVAPFEALINDDRFDVLAIVAQPDKPIGRKQVLKAPETKELAIKYNIPCLQPEKASTEEFINKIKILNPDIIFVLAYGQILSEEFLNIPKYKCINLHASLLPKLRGASPIHMAILEGLEKTGITYMQMEKGLDSGPIIKQYETELGDKNIINLYEELKNLGADTVSDVLFYYINGDLSSVEQDHDKASFCRTIKKEEGEIFLEKEDADYIIRKYKAFLVWPGIFIIYKGKRIKLLDIEKTELKSENPGLLEKSKNCLYLQAKDYKIKLNELQLEGKNRITAKDYLNSQIEL